MSVLQDFRAEGLTDQLGIGGNPTPEFLPFAIKENFDRFLAFCNSTLRIFPG
ncbi:MAG TPA: hypothetical protein VJ953_13355 [Saprospiraceae bacterium]|nr:hypothetical protein [Saprospiraceae bacterium]